MSTQNDHFTVILNGQIEYAEYPGASNLVCQYQFVYGPDWEIVRVSGEAASLEAGMTQIALRAPGFKSIYVWNFPIEIAFNSTNPFGWPKICLMICESNGIDKLPVRGYGWCHVPLSAGSFVNTVRLFSPRNSSIIQSIIGAIQGKTPEFVTPTFVCESEGREAIRVKNEGAVRIKWDVMIKDMKQFGLDVPKKALKKNAEDDEGTLLDKPLSKKL